MIFNKLYRFRFEIFFFVLLLFLVCAIFYICPKQQTKNIINILENGTFDVRQSIISKNKHASEDIIIISVDDPSYEFLIDKYGDWPIPRNVYAQIVEYIQGQNPKYMLLDLLFVRSLKRVPGSDKKLVEVFKKYPNTYTGISFDEYSFEIRKPPVIDKKISTDIENHSKTLSVKKYTNCRTIIDELIQVTNKIGHFNIPRHDDGLIRSVPLIIKYPRYNPDNLEENSEEYYLYATLKLAIDYLNRYENAGIDKIVINEDNTIKLGTRTVPLTENGEAILNWYGDSGMKDKTSFRYISFWQVLKSMEAKNSGGEEKFKDLFKDKIVYIGTSVYALSDAQSVPTGKYFPGVELHATLLNNILDNALIRKAPILYNIIICILLAVLTVCTVFKIRSTPVSVAAFLIMNFGYLYFSVFVAEKYNLWVWVIIPVFTALFCYICSYIIKYLLKSRDYENTYKLATIDDLTELYNHRFFREILEKEIQRSKQTQTNFSLILIDIDLFKNFNDTYGHQAGDAVLKHVASTLKENVRTDDFVCRYGGEEMTIILNNTKKEAAEKIAQKICDAVAGKRYDIGHSTEVNITISLGVSTYPENGTTIESLIEYADKCMYNAKSSGRNRVGKMNFEN